MEDFQSLLSIGFETVDRETQNKVQQQIRQFAKNGSLHSGNAMMRVAEEFAGAMRQKGQIALASLDRSLRAHGLYPNESNRAELSEILYAALDAQEKRSCELAAATPPFRSGIIAAETALGPIRTACNQEKQRLRVEVNLMAAKSKLILDEVAIAILARLKEEFISSHRSAADLANTYEGPSLTEVENEVISNLGISKVDYDLALKNLEDNGLVKTGPMQMYDNPPNTGFVIVAIISKRQFLHLTEAGYRASSTIKSAAPRPRPQTVVTITGSTFHQSPVGVGQTVTQSLNFDVGDQNKSVNYLMDLLSKGSIAVDASAKADVTQMVQSATDGNMAAAKPIFQRLFGAAEEAVKQLAYGVLTAIITKQMGL
ncbi:hypothetical protein ACLBXO_28705 [Methylobacterium sp. C33D]